MHRDHYSFLISYKYHNFQLLFVYHTLVLVRKCLCLIFIINISVAQSEYTNQVLRASHSRYSAPHQKLPTQDGQSHQQGTDYNILARRNETYNLKMHRDHYSFLISYKYHNFQSLCICVSLYVLYSKSIFHWLS